jgi:ribosomal protein S18 acetylase RimI-like enzyme
MRYLKNFNESFNNIQITECNKSIEGYNFVAKYLDILDFDSYINNENLYQICAYYGTNIVGVSIFKMKDGKIHMNYSSVDPDYRNKGINKEMKLKIIEIGRENGCTIITSNVRQSNISSLKSQKGVGFKVNDRVNLTYPDGEKKLPLYLHL